MLVLVWDAHAVLAQRPSPTPNSAESSPRSDTRVISACAAAVDELKASRELIAALDAELTSQRSRLETERRINAVLTELNDTRRSESEALGRAVAAKNETIAAKDAVIASQEKLIESLRSKRSSPWRRIGDILIGAAAIALIK